MPDKRGARIEEHYFYYIFESFEQYRLFMYARDVICADHLSYIKYIHNNDTGGVPMRDYARQLWATHANIVPIRWYLNDDLRQLLRART